MYFPWFPLWSQNYFYPSNIFDFRNSFQNFIEVARKLDFGFHSSLNLGWRCRGRGSHDRNLAVSKELTLFLVTKNHKILIRRKKIVFYLLEIASNGTSFFIWSQGHFSMELGTMVGYSMTTLSCNWWPGTRVRLLLV